MIKSIYKLIVTLLLALMTCSQWVYADDFASYTQFFILSDRSYSIQEQAQVRLEMQDVNLVHENAGVEIAVYKVPHPIAFLQSQKNLHRISTQAQAQKPGLWNSIVAIWDYVAKTARTLVRKHFSEDARRTTVEVAPDLHSANTPHVQQHVSAYKPLKGYEMVARFRYPLQFGKDIKPAQATLDGANVEGTISYGGDSFNTGFGQSEVLTQPSFSNGNVYVPIGKLPAGLYIVEAMLGEQRAVTMVFVGDTVAVTKTSSSGLFVWAVNRITGAPVANVETHWSDGVGELATAKTNAQGWVQMQHQAPEQTYLFAVDAQGGVLISENYFYNSEIYNAKVYASTDKPLYRPGDMVNIKVVGREFINAKSSKPLPDAPMQLAVFDPNGLPVAKQRLQFKGVTGGDSTFQLPVGSVAGGYEIQLNYQGETYSAAFRVANFQKPHFQISLNVDQDDLKVNSKIPVQLQLRYPDGKPVKNATVELDLKAQALSIVDGDLGYSGLFPIKLSSQSYTTDAGGNLKIELPEVKQASRYIVSALAADGAAYRVRHTQELLIERAESHWNIKALNRFTAPKQTVHFAMRQLQNTDQANTKPSRWKWLRLEDQTQAEGSVQGDANKGFDIQFEKSGSYTVSLLNAEGKILGATSHWVSGPDLKVPVGHIEVVWDKSAYQVGDVATALVSFSEPIQHALLTLERDSIEQTSLLNAPSAWLETKKIADQQWQVSVPVTGNFSPNITFSVAYVKNNEFVFENAGILVASPQIHVKVSANKKQYLPGELVKLSIDTTLQSASAEQAAKPVSAQVSLSVVDEMIYVLQPEIAPSIVDFFYHPRRNNVRTQYSQSFIGYDVSTNQLGVAPKSHGVQQRATKVLERPRRDEVDTALWAPNISTDVNGHAEISFRMPDALTRWRITARAMNADGVVGQSLSNVLSHKDFYIKWTSPNWMRSTDSAIGNVAIFNQTKQEQKVILNIIGALTQSQALTLQPGINFVDVPRKGVQTGRITLTLSHADKIYDSLAINLKSLPNNWLTHYSKLLEPKDGQLNFAMPADASNIKLRLLDHPRAAFYRVVDDLAEQPYGCVEQTASRLIPLSLVYKALPEDDARRTTIMRQLYTHRMRLASMAGPDAHFGWWGADMAVDPFLTTYAYYADWRTAQALQLDLPAEHWQHLLTLYSETGFQQTPWQRALMLDWMAQIGLPVDSLVTALAQDLISEDNAPKLNYGLHDSRVLTTASAETHDLAMVLTSKLLKSKVAGFDEKLSLALDNVKLQESLLAKALLHVTGYQAADVSILLELVSSDSATIDRSIMLTWLDNALSQDSKTTAVTLAKPWLLKSSKTNSPVYLWPKQGEMKTLPATLATSYNAVLNYDSVQPNTTSTLPAQLERKLYLLKKQSDGSFETSPLDAGDAVTTDGLYLDEITLTPTQALRYMVIEAALPAGAQVEPSTWGVDIKDKGALPKANYQDLLGQYVVPVGNVSKTVVVQHLLRFSQRGEYKLPAARAYNMYSPDAQVVETKPINSIRVK
jgi:alpha-2-macroglobulin